MHHCLRLFSLFFVLICHAASAAPDTTPAATETALFAGGCFWCLEPPFDKLPGVLQTTSGYSGGKLENPSYKQVSRGGTGHREVIQITFDPDQVTYSKLLEVFWHNIDPTDDTGQFCDKGFVYTSAIYYAGEAQKSAAIASLEKQRMDKPFSQELVTPVLAASTFYPAEDYHQDYYLKNPLRYKFYRSRCGRDQRLNELWGAKK